ncbi:MAG: DUF72 domain-containing protein [Dyadobacter fermentans]
MEAKRLFMGTSGLVLPYKNRQEYPPEFEGLSRMQVCGALFNSIEVNSIFYKLPRTSTVAQWSESVPGSFRFTFKLWKQITHNKGLEFDSADIRQFFTVIEGAGSRQGCVLVQLPASVKPALFNKLDSLLASIREANASGWPIAVELRSPDWYKDPLYELLNEYDAALVYHDKAGSISPHAQLDASHVYLRFHGPGGDYRGSYDQGLLYEFAGYIAEWLGDGKTVYVYFNNTVGAALDNLRTLQKFLMEDYDIS